MNVVKYDWQLSEESPFIYDLQRYRSDFSFPGNDMHGDLHLLIMFKGRFQTRIGSSSFDYQGGDLILIAPWEIHGSYTAAAGTELLSITIFCRSLRSGLAALAPQLDALLLLPPEERMQLLRQNACVDSACSHARRLLDSKKVVVMAGEQRLAINGFEFSAAERTFEFIRILELFAVILQNIGFIESNGGKLDWAEHLTAALQLLESGSVVPLSAGRAAAECNLSCGYFNIIFKKLYGISFYTYELKYRLRRAEADLCSGQYSVKEIAQRNGFADTSHFSKTFKKYYFAAPSDYAATADAVK